jgi:hypothetical protein
MKKQYTTFPPSEDAFLPPKKLSLLVLKNKIHKNTILIVRLVYMLKLSASDFFLGSFRNPQ